MLEGLLTSLLITHNSIYNIMAQIFGPSYKGMTVIFEKSIQSPSQFFVNLMPKFASNLCPNSSLVFTAQIAFKNSVLQTFA